MKTEDLIANLASQVEAVRPLPPPPARLFQWSLLAVVNAAAGIALFGARPDLASALGQPVFQATLVLALGTAILSAAAALVLAIPAAERVPVARTTAAILAGLWLTTLVVAIVRAGSALAFGSHEAACFSRAAGIGLVPGGVLFVMLRRALPLRLAWAGGLAAAAATAAGALAVQIICPIDDPAHALAGHFGPVAALGAVGAALAGQLLEKRADIERRR
jgi:hypothetical protein